MSVNELEDIIVASVASDNFHVYGTGVSTLLA